MKRKSKAMAPLALTDEPPPRCALQTFMLALTSGA